MSSSPEQRNIFSSFFVLWFLVLMTIQLLSADAVGVGGEKVKEFTEEKKLDLHRN